VQRGTADLAFGPVPADPPGTVVPVGDEELVLVVPFDDRLAGRTTVPSRRRPARPRTRRRPGPAEAGPGLRVGRSDRSERATGIEPA
jgi:DNA-binding transcriptional LysR family regulator